MGALNVGSVALVATLLLAYASAIDAKSAASRIRPLREYPILQCGTCELMGLEIGRRVNITTANNKGQSYVKGHRLGKGQSDKDDRRSDYQASELQAVEVLELLCQDIRKHARFVYDERTKLRMIAPDNSAQARRAKPAALYTKREESRLANIEAHCADFCEAVLEDFEGVLVDNIRRHRTADKLVEGMCKYGLQICEMDRLQEAARVEVNRRTSFDERGDRDL